MTTKAKFVVRNDVINVDNFNELPSDWQHHLERYIGKPYEEGIVLGLSARYGIEFEPVLIEYEPPEIWTRQVAKDVETASLKEWLKAEYGVEELDDVAIVMDYTDGWYYHDLGVNAQYVWPRLVVQGIPHRPVRGIFNSGRYFKIVLGNGATELILNIDFPIKVTVSRSLEDYFIEATKRNGYQMVNPFWNVFSK